MVRSREPSHNRVNMSHVSFCSPSSCGAGCCRGLVMQQLLLSEYQRCFYRFRWDVCSNWQRLYRVTNGVTTNTTWRNIVGGRRQRPQREVCTAGLLPAILHLLRVPGNSIIQPRHGRFGRYGDSHEWRCRYSSGSHADPSAGVRHFDWGPFGSWRNWFEGRNRLGSVQRFCYHWYWGVVAWLVRRRLGLLGLLAR